MSQFHKNQIVVFGRTCGEQTLGRVIRVNKRTLSVVTLESRGASARKGAGRKWRVTPSLCRAATDAEIDGSGASQATARQARRTKARANRRPARPVRRRSDAEILRDLLSVECQLSPENLTCDGELPQYRVRQRAAKLNRQRRTLVAELGREPTDTEIWDQP
jgi:hypothetical protein